MVTNARYNWTSLKAYTQGGAYGAFEEESKGTITVGKLADFAVLDTDLFTIAPVGWLKAKVVYTLSMAKSSIKNCINKICGHP